jgi:hypothetical protein
MFSFSPRQGSRLTFLCRSEDEGVIAPPVPAKAHLPDWFRKLPAVSRDHVSTTNNGLTVKRCMPFLDAMTTGWLLTLAATVRLEITQSGTVVNAGWEFDRVMVSNHGAHQVSGNPKEPRPPCKFHNYWSIRTAPGWSCLFVPPLNRPSQPFECVSGIVDTDTYFADIHLPFFASAPDGIYTIEKGTPLVQVIPVRRDATVSEAEIRAESELEALEREKVHRNTLAGEGWYRKFSRADR